MFVLAAYKPNLAPHKVPNLDHLFWGPQGSISVRALVENFLLFTFSDLFQKGVDFFFDLEGGVQG